MIVRMPELIPEMTGRLAKAKLAAIDTATTPATILLFLAGGIMMAIDVYKRQPLTSIIGAASSYTENSNHLTEEEKTELVTQINDDANWLLNMVENLLTVTRIQNDESHVSTSLEVVEEVVSEAVQRLRKRIPHAKINISIPEAFLMVPMDPLLIEQVIMNLLENAVIHSESKQAVDLVVTDLSLIHI